MFTQFSLGEVGNDVEQGFGENLDLASLIMNVMSI